MRRRNTARQHIQIFIRQLWISSGSRRCSNWLPSPAYTCSICMVSADWAQPTTLNVHAWSTLTLEAQPTTRSRFGQANLLAWIFLTLDFALDFDPGIPLSVLTLGFDTRFRYPISTLDFASPFRRSISTLHFDSPFRLPISTPHFASPFRLPISTLDS
jgi:hypothetical protein